MTPNTEQATERVTHRSRFEKLSPGREPFLTRAVEGASVTVPGLFPPTGTSGATQYDTPFQAVGARGVNNLASKLLLALLPPGSSFFRLTMDDFLVAKLSAQFPDNPEAANDARATFDEALARVERAVSNRLEQVGARTVVFETVKQLLIAGNALVQILPTGKLLLHTLRNYVVKRDASGNVLDIVVVQKLTHASLPPEAQAVAQHEGEGETDAPDADRVVELYTRITRTSHATSNTSARNMWTVSQEIDGNEVPGTYGTYPEDKSPWLPLRFSHITNEDYGRGFVEEYSGDLLSLEAISEALVRFTSVAAKIVFLVNPNGTTDKTVIARAKSGAVVDGDEKDVSTLSLDKYNDFRVAKEMADELTRRLEQAFLMDSAAQRQAERVTAEEIRMIANSLEVGLGGFYSILGEEFQRPLVARVMFQMQKEKALPVLPKEAVNPSLVTGLEALGRNADLQRLDVLITGAAQTFGPDVVAQYVNAGSYFTRRAAALGVDSKGLVRTDAEVNAAKQQEMQAAQAQAAVPGIVQGAADQAQQQQDMAMQQQQQQPTGR